MFAREQRRVRQNKDGGKHDGSANTRGHGCPRALPGVLGGLLLVIRTVLEDGTLQRELDGYREYAGCVRYRLLPGVW